MVESEHQQHDFESFEYWVSIARVCTKTKRFDRAVDAYKNAESRFEHRNEIWARFVIDKIVRLNLEIGRYDDAITELKRIQSIFQRSFIKKHGHPHEEILKLTERTLGLIQAKRGNIIK